MDFRAQEYDIRNAHKTEKDLLVLIGVYPQLSSKKIAYFLATVLNLFLSISQIVSMTAELVIDRKDLSKVSESLQYFITVATFMCKFINFVIYKKTLLDIEETLTSSIFYDHLDDRFTLLQQKISSCKTVGKLFRILVIGAVTMYALTPYLDPEKHMSLPIPGWFPYNTSDYYYITFAYQMLGIANTAYTNSTIDILTWMLISVTSGQFEILKENLRSIDYGNENVEETKSTFRKCVQHHKEIVRLVDLIERMFSKGIFLQFFNSVIAICFTGFMMIIVPVYSMQFGLLVMYFLCIILQIAMYCWYGHDVMTTSSTIGESFYMSNWYKSDLSTCKNVIIFLEKTKKPVTLTAGGFVTLSLTTLTGILRSSYSYFAVLQHMYTK